MSDQTPAVEPSSDRNMWVAVALIAIILIVLGVAGATARRSRTQPGSDAVDQA